MHCCRSRPPTHTQAVLFAFVSLLGTVQYILLFASLLQLLYMYLLIAEPYAQLHWLATVAEIDQA